MYGEPECGARSWSGSRTASPRTRRAGPRRCGRRAALRLMGRRALAGRLRGVRRAVVGAHPRSAVGVPTIHFGTGTTTLLAAMARAGGDVIGLDWRIALDDGWALVGDDRGVQGNLDPAAAARAVGPGRGRGAGRAHARGWPARPHLQSRARGAARDGRRFGDAARRARPGGSGRRSCLTRPLSSGRCARTSTTRSSSARRRSM